MKICFICKYPPIQGGVSSHCYWLAYGLAEKGHQVYVVTNADEVEALHKVNLTEADKQSDGNYARFFPDSKGSVKVFSTNPQVTEAIYYIPEGNPTVSRLATMACDVILDEGCELIYSSYLEPYCIAAQLASFWTKKPLITTHAGSDLYQLFDVKEIQSGYVNVFRNSNRIISGGGSAEKIRAFGIPKERFINIEPAIPPIFSYSANADSDLNALLQKSIELPHPEELKNCFLPLENESLPILGVYGKYSSYKGHLDLLYAAADLIKGGFQFYLAIMSNAVYYQNFLNLIIELNLADYVKFIPFQPHWRVPEFIRGCQAIAFLERDFPIAQHTPTVPKEVIKCGKCLITSSEVAFKESFNSQIRNLKNIIIVPDPKNIKMLSQGIRYALEDAPRSKKIGESGYQELRIESNFDSYISRMSSLFKTVSKEKPIYLQRSHRNPVCSDEISLANLMNSFFPNFSEIVETEHLSQIENEPLRFDSNVLEDVYKTLDVITKAEKTILKIIKNKSEKFTFYKELIDYEKRIYEFLAKKPLITEKENKIKQEKYFISSELIGSLTPVIRCKHEVVDYHYDLVGITRAIFHKTDYKLESTPTKILFHDLALPNKINNLTEKLLHLIKDDKYTSYELFELFWSQTDPSQAPEKDFGKNNFFSLVERLYWSQIIDFR